MSSNGNAEIAGMEDVSKKNASTNGRGAKMPVQVVGMEIDGMEFVSMENACMENASIETAGPAYTLTMLVPLFGPNMII